MRVAMINTGTELLLGDVVNAHLDFIAREIFALGLRIQEQRTVPDGEAIRHALSDLFPHCEILFVTGGLGPTSDDITREIVADVLGLQLRQDAQLLESLKERLAIRKITWTASIARQADVPGGAQILPNEHGSASGLYLPANLSPRIASPHIIVLPGPPRELQPMFQKSVMAILRTLTPLSNTLNRCVYRIAGIGESLVEKRIGDQVLAIPGIELGYCARPGDVDVRIVGEPTALARADEIIRDALGISIYSTSGENLEDVLVKRLAEKKETLAVAESCTGGLLANRITNVPGASDVFIAGYVTYANAAKIDILRIDPELLNQHGAVSDPVARAMAEGARTRTGSTFALATTGIAGPSGGSPEKPVGTAYVGFASALETITKKFFFPTDRETFKDLVAQTAFDLLRRQLCSTSS
jgi:nicotinamide-nucleotide amidase